MQTVVETCSRLQCNNLTQHSRFLFFFLWRYTSCVTLWWLEATWEAHSSQKTLGEITIGDKPTGDWSFPLLDSNIWIPTGQAVIMQSWRNVQNIGLKEKKNAWYKYNDFSEMPQFGPVRNQWTWKTFWFVEIIRNYPKWRFSEKENGRVLINMRPHALLFVRRTFFLLFFSIFVFPIKIVIMKRLCDQYCLRFDIRYHWLNIS